MSKPITIKAVRVDGPLQLTLDWSTAETLRLDFAGLVKPPFDALKDPAFFAQVALEPWGGHGLDWPVRTVSWMKNSTPTSVSW